MSFIEDFFKKKRQESESATQPTDTANFTFDPSKARMDEVQTTSGGALAPTNTPKIPASSPAVDFSSIAKPVTTTQDTPSIGRTGEGTTSEGQGVQIDQGAYFKSIADREKAQRELVQKAKEGGVQFVEKLDPTQKEELVTGLQREKDRKAIIRAYDPNLDSPIDSTPYWQDPNQLRDVTHARLDTLGLPDNTNYAEEQFRAGAREGMTFGYDKELQGLFGAPTQDPGNPQGIGENLARAGGILAGNIANPITWGIFGGASKLMTPVLGDTLVWGLATDAVAGGAIGGLWNTGESLGSLEDSKKRLEGIAIGGLTTLIFGGLIRGGVAAYDVANGGVARITKGLGVEKQGTVFGKDGEILSSELGLVKFVPETNSYIIKPESSKIIGDGADWFSEINASQPNKGRVWSSDGLKKIEFEKGQNGDITFTTTEWTHPQAVERLKQASIEEVPALIKAIGEGPKPDTPAAPETFTIKNQSIPRWEMTNEQLLSEIQNAKKGYESDKFEAFDRMKENRPQILSAVWADNIDTFIQKMDGITKMLSDKPNEVTIQDIYDSPLKLELPNEDGDMVDYRETLLQEFIDGGKGDNTISQVMRSEDSPKWERSVLRSFIRDFRDELSLLSKEHELDSITPSLKMTGMYERSKIDFKWAAEKLGLDKEGITDSTVEWVENWVNRHDKVITVPKDVEEQLSKYKPEKPVTLYRGKDPQYENREYSSWTYDKSVAERFANKVKDDKGIVESQSITPEEISVDFTMLPERLLQKYTAGMESEVIVKKIKKSQEPVKDYHGIVAQKYGVENLARNKANVSKEYLKLVRSLPDGWKIELKERVYDGDTEVIAQSNSETRTVTMGTKEWRENTAYHESLHAHMAETKAADPKLWRRVLDDGRKQYGVTEEMAAKEGYTVDGLVEELLADEVEYKSRTGEYKTEGLLDSIKKFIDRLIEKIKGLFGNNDPIKAIFDAVIDGKKDYGYKTRGWQALEKTIKNQEWTGPSAEDVFGGEVPKKPEPNYVTNQKSDEEMIAKLEAMKGGETPAQFLKNNKAAITRTADNLASIFNGNPTMTEVQKFLKGKSYEIMQAAFAYASKRNMIDVKQVDQIIGKLEMSMAQKAVNTKGSGLTSQQKAVVISMEGYGSLLKGTEDYKINMTQLSESLKAIGARQHFVETPSAERKRIPFTLMGNKASTMQRVIQPLIEQAIADGRDVYVEPFSGAGTTLYVLPNLFEKGLTEANLNFFDREKYIVVNAIKNKEINVEESVNKAWDKVIDTIADDLMQIPAVKDVMETYGAKPGTPRFYAVAELAFYPQYTKQFFAETPDAKLAKNGELTDTFKEWLKEKVMKDQNIEEADAQAITDQILSDTSLFEKNYPEISKNISDRLEAFDNIDNVKTVDDALVTTFARHFKQRGSSGQRVVSASGGFQDMLGAYKKTMEGLTNYQRILDKHGEKINIANMDGKEFIKKMSEEKDLAKTVAYFDPPYVRTTGVYVKNAPEAIKMSLWEYADYEKIPGIFSPLKDAIGIYTNDIDGKYYEALNSIYGERMGKNILGYREGTTPTSVVTTSELVSTPAKLNLDYYQLVRSSRLKNKMEALSEDLLPMVQDQLKKELGKVIKEIFAENQKIVDELTKIREGQEKAQISFDNLKEAIEGAVSGRDKQAILQEAYRTARHGNITGKGLVNMLRFINKLWEDRLEAIRDFRERLRKFESSKTVDVEQKQAFIKEFEGAFTVKRLTSTNKMEIEAVEKGLRGEELTTPEEKVYQDYLMNDETYRKIEGMRGKKSIYDMDIDQIKRATEDMKQAIELASDQYQYNQKLIGDYTDQLAEKAKARATPIEYHETKGNIENKSLKQRLANRVKLAGASSHRMADYFTGSNWMINERLNAQFMKDIIDEGAWKYRLDFKKVHDQEVEISKRNKLTNRNYQRIMAHSYAKEWDGTGARLLAYQLEKDGEDFATGEEIPKGEIGKRILEYARDDYLTEGEREWYEFARKAYDETGIKVQATNVEVYNKSMGFVEGYTPHFVDYKKSPIQWLREDAMDQELGVIINGNLRINTEQGFTIERKGGKFYPMMDARKVFYRHMGDAIWYAEMQGPLKIVQQVVKKSPEAWGKDGMKWWESYIDILARNGKVKTVDEFGKVVEQLKNNMTDAVLIANLGSIVKQFSNLTEALNVSGKVPVVNMAIVLKPEVWKEIHEKSHMLQFRNLEVMNLNFNPNIEEVFDKIHKAVREKAYLPMQYADLWVGTALWKSIYDDAIKAGKTEAFSVNKADNLVKYAISSPFLEDLPKFIINNRRGATSIFTQFQTPALNHFSNLRFMGGKEAADKFGKWGAVLMTIASAFFLYSVIDVAVSKGWAKIKGSVPANTGADMFDSLASQIGPLGILFGKGKYGDMSAKNVYDSVTGAYKSIAANPGKHDIAIYNFLKATLTVVGFPGISNIAPLFKPETKKTSTKKFWEKDSSSKKKFWEK